MGEGTIGRFVGATVDEFRAWQPHRKKVSIMARLSTCHACPGLSFIVVKSHTIDAAICIYDDVGNVIETTSAHYKSGDHQKGRRESCDRPKRMAKKVATKVFIVRCRS